MMKRSLFRYPALIAAMIMLGACSTTRFYPHEASENAYPGKGGSRFTVEGIDVWFNGEPSHRYAILGYIEDPRGLYADRDHRSVESGVLEKAREAGADALIELPLPESIGPTSSIMFGSGGGFGRSNFGMGMGFGLSGLERISVKYVAVRYLDKP